MVGHSISFHEAEPSEIWREVHSGVRKEGTRGGWATNQNLKGVQTLLFYTTPMYIHVHAPSCISLCLKLVGMSPPPRPHE